MTSRAMTAGTTTTGTTTAGTTTTGAMTAGLTWQLLLRATPDQVYDALERAAVTDGRIRECDEHDRWLVFSGIPGGPGERTSLCAYVRQHEHGSLLQFGAPVGRARTFRTRSEGVQGEVAEAASIGSLVHRMRSYLGASPMPVR